MSADNWALCPKCLPEHREQINDLRIEAQAAYGKVDHKKYVKMMNDLAVAERQPLEETLREDYELGTGEDGVFSVSYSCRCTVCGFSYTFRDRQSAIGARTKE